MSDRIEKTIELNAPVSRVWKALTDYREFGTWFRVELEGPFVAGKPARGRTTNPGCALLAFEVMVQKIEPERHFSFTWHPYAVDPKVDYSKEPQTLVEFTLEKTATGTRLTVVESGFDKIPAHRRAEAFRMDDMGWGMQMENIARHVGHGG
jgi:uncharacterized protein YndB with AHSA1/START domain